MKIILYYISHNTYPNGGEKQSYIAFVQDLRIIKAEMWLERVGTDSFVWFKNYRHKENI